MASMFNQMPYLTLFWPSKSQFFLGEPPSGTVGVGHNNKIDVAIVWTAARTVKIKSRYGGKPTKGPEGAYGECM